ncbi:MAG: trehalose-phosphatase [Oceanicaulis sp.]
MGADALFLDFDGTLADIVDDPDAAALPPGFGGVLASIADAYGGAVAVVSGRAVESLDARLPKGLWRVGGHGAEIAAPGKPPQSSSRIPDAVAEAARWLDQSYPGVKIEPKPTGVAVHFRHARHAENACRQALERALEAAPGYVLQEGKCVIEARPAGLDKGAALQTLMKQAPFKGKRPIAIGDDVTDGSMMMAAKRAGGLGLGVGVDLPGAQRRFEHPVEVRAWLIGKLAPPRSRRPEPEFPRSEALIAGAALTP